MQIYNFFLFIYFINLCNSFILSNNLFSRKYNNNLNMGCDFYIDKDLQIYDYNNIIISHINLDKEKGYYWFASILDEDEDDYETEYKKYIEDTLQPKMNPILIYSNNSFNKLFLENKYKEMIERELNVLNKTWNDINKIIKVENRYER